MPDPRVVATAAAALHEAAVVVCRSPAVADGLRRHGLTVAVGDPADCADGSLDAVALLDDELSTAEHEEVLVARTGKALRAGGLLAVSAVSALHAAANHVDLGGIRGYRGSDVRQELGHSGFHVELLCGPGAAATVAGHRDGPAVLALDRQPGLLDAAPRILAVGRRGANPADRSAAFFTSLPRKVVAAAVLCRDSAGRLLVVHDSFKRAWTIPGGIVDADEDPRSGAIREAWEEAGVRVDATTILGAFAGSWPDRVVLVYEAVPVPGELTPRGPVNALEIDAVEWVDLDEALRRLAPSVAFQVRACLEQPGSTHVLPLGF